MTKQGTITETLSLIVYMIDENGSIRGYKAEGARGGYSPSYGSVNPHWEKSKSVGEFPKTKMYCKWIVQHQCRGT